ncbi:MAG: bifunctional DNA-formamidopyrimidine glycosylase/DNA-(apurinic or apyrimidinic site) lyase [Candidatus Cloacimonetes bacterium]|nr:bifunctional DNA-formamidopyrimidine glycosylase/DNA-(apurinic or apyrimidinic site) lyase [Candidatus Cloacimonadota bacterium]
MPELPEVQTVVNSLNELIIGKEITSIEELHPRTLINQKNINIIGSKIISVNRRGKYLIFVSDGDWKILAHLRMTGKFIIVKNYDKTEKHIRALIRFSDDSYLLFKDVRTFGFMEILKANDKPNSLEKLGPEPLLKSFNKKYLTEKLRNRKGSIKTILLNQHIIAGLGNIYVAEILYKAKISPLRAGNSLKKNEIDLIVKYTKSILKKAIEKNGTTIIDFSGVDQKSGEFQNFLHVYQKKRCKCGNPIIKIKQAGRSSFYCERCQK